MRPKLDRAGEVFGFLTVLRDAEPLNGSRRVLCRCRCGTTKAVLLVNLTQGGTKSCGCHKAQAAIGRAPGNKKHGKSGTVEFETWVRMRQRCNNENDSNYSNYGGRGISICERWNDFALFLADVGQRPSSRHSLDRKDNNGPYSPENCRWATPSQQSTNRRTTRFLTFNGETLTLWQWAKRLKINAATLYTRSNRGLPSEEILAPSDYRRPTMITFEGQTRPLREWANLTGIKMQTLHYRVSAGWPVDKLFIGRQDL